MITEMGSCGIFSANKNVKNENETVNWYLRSKVCDTLQLLSKKKVLFNQLQKEKKKNIQLGCVCMYDRSSIFQIKLFHWPVSISLVDSWCVLLEEEALFVRLSIRNASIRALSSGTNKNRNSQSLGYNQKILQKLTRNNLLNRQRSAVKWVFRVG